MIVIAIRLHANYVFSHFIYKHCIQISFLLIGMKWMRQMYATGQKTLKISLKQNDTTLFWFKHFPFLLCKLYTVGIHLHLLDTKNFRFIFIHMLDECKTVFWKTVLNKKMQRIFVSSAKCNTKGEIKLFRRRMLTYQKYGKCFRKR